MRETLLKATQDFKIQLSETQLSQLETYFKLLIEWNEKINLTAITDAEGVAIKHFADSLTFFNYIDVPQNSTLIDVGTGAGFPGVVLKIARPDIRLTLLDSLNKRLIFLDEVCKQTAIEAELVHARAEDGGRNPLYREKFDFAVSRAVARLNVLSEYTLPFVRVGGSLVAMKGPQADEEIKASYSAVNTLGGKIKSVHSFELPIISDSRNIVEIKKLRATPQKYPRNSGKIKSNPL